MHQHESNKSEAPLSYESLNLKLIRESSPQKEVQHNGYYARDNKKGFIELMAERDMSEPCEEGIIFGKCDLKFHISLPENDRELYAQGWDIAKDVLIEEDVLFFKVAHEKSRMSQSKIPDEEKGSQRGKDITIYTGCNPEFSSQDWLRVIKRVTVALAAANIPPGYETIKKGGRADESMKANPYCSYRYEKKKPEEDLIALGIEDIHWGIEYLELHNLQWVDETSSSEGAEKEESLSEESEGKEGADSGEKEEKGNQKEEGKKGCCSLG
jgi:hypothetical protein